MIPSSLRSVPQWMVSGDDKAPRSVSTGTYADFTNPIVHAPFDVAQAYAEQHGYDVGFVLTPDDPFAVVDLDAPETEEQASRHTRILDAFDTYAELSRSGKGVHIWCLGAVPSGKRRDKVEVYSSHRYMICTGRVIKDRPVSDQQQLLHLLYEEIARGTLPTTELVEVEELLTDQEIFDMAMNAVNGHKFEALCKGEWEGDYPSQSEADFALMNMLCFYSRANQQCRRLFRYSALGRRDKAQRDRYLDYMISKIRAEELPPVDFSAILNSSSTNSAQASTSLVVEPAASPGPTQKPPSQVPAEVRNNGGGKATTLGFSYPPGLVGEIARYIVASSTRPVAEVGTAAALALCAGMLGRQFNISGTGLNQYIILLAKTGVGKEGADAGIERVLAQVREKVPAVIGFTGPGTFASGQGLLRTFDEKPCFFSLLGEFGLTLQNLSDTMAAPYMVAMRRALLDLYSKSGKDSVVNPTAYSDNTKNTKMLRSPALTILGDATPETFYAGLAPSHIADGLIPRFLIIEYFGNRPDRNEQAFFEPNPQLIERVAELAATALRMSANNSFAEVTLSPEAKAVLDAFDRECDKHINQGKDEANRQLWNRAHLKALRAAALLAAADRPHNPVVTEGEAKWAVELVRNDTLTIAHRFEIGDIGEGASKQSVDVARVLRDYLDRSPSELTKYGVTESMHSRRVVPYQYIQRRTTNLAAFRKDRRGARNALRDTVMEMVDSAILREIPRKQCMDEFGTHGKLYYISGQV